MQQLTDKMARSTNQIGTLRISPASEGPTQLPTATSRPVQASIIALWKIIPKSIMRRVQAMRRWCFRAKAEGVEAPAAASAGDPPSSVSAPCRRSLAQVPVRTFVGALKFSGL